VVTMAEVARVAGVSNIAAMTTTAISPANVPTRWSSMVASLRTAPGPATSGAMSPDALTMNLPPAWWKPATAGGKPELSPTWPPLHPPLGHLPDVVEDGGGHAWPGLRVCPAEGLARHHVLSSL
jgi:hypothetical protein